ncbi:J domain-containing protein [Lysobacter silvisoli]|uniref:J domain-containing protein n=1 Tax=Lysobacter silvisoli TaxID=2293254 RepID=A0A371K2L3_9GAMM|nr:J domain-containing protein [Lysobacter silvisoli]RDZ28128.1 hypothetical protein DX914_03005 [Lysobacter silvisoli]
MRNPFALLGLKRDADEAAIKRAYAQRLRQNRPDEDPAAFQALNEAYRRCLEIAANRDEWQDDDEEMPLPSEVAGSGGAADAADEAQPSPYDADEVDETSEDDSPRFVRRSFDVDGFLHELSERAQTDPPHALDAWLRSLEPLYSLELKQALRTPVASMLAHNDPLPPPHALRLILQFFDLDGVSSDDDWLRRQLSERLREAHEAHALDQEIARYRSPGEETPVDREMMHELLGPRRWLRRLFLLLVPLLPSRLMSLLLTLEQDYPSAADARLSPESKDFWRRVTDRDNLNWRRLMVTPLRMALYGGGLLGLVALFDANTRPLQDVAMSFAVLTGVLLAWTLITTACRRLATHLERMRGYYPPLLYAGLWFAAGLIASHWWPAVAIILLFAVGYVWSLPRSWPEHMVVVAAMMTGAFATHMIGRFALNGGQSEGLTILNSAYAGAIPVLHDLLYAWCKRLSLDEARRRVGWTGWIAAAHMILAASLPMWLSLLKH